MKTIDELMEGPCWVIDFLPKQVPADSAGQFFAVEEFFLDDENKLGQFGVFANMLLKLNCYYDFEVLCLPSEQSFAKPDPVTFASIVMACARADGVNALRIRVGGGDSLITLESSDLCMTLYGPDEDLLELVRALAGAHGLFVWQPPTTA